MQILVTFGKQLQLHYNDKALAIIIVAKLDKPLSL